MWLFACPECGKAVTYPLSRGWRIFWWVLAVMTATAGVGANATLHEGYSWIPAGVGLLSFVILCIDVGLQRRAAQAYRHIAPLPIVADDDNRPAANRIDPKRPREAAPVYVATLTVVIMFSVLSSLLGALAVAGLNNAYSYEVVLQQASPATTQDGYGSAMNLTQSGGVLCGDDEDYNGCLNMHIAMYNSVCVGTTLTSSAQSTCESLLDFIDDVRAQVDTCGAGCTTQADAEGRWGWEYLRPSPGRASILNDNAVSEIKYQEHCLFSLGPIQIGSCPGQPGSLETAEGDARGTDSQRLP